MQEKLSLQEEQAMQALWKTGEGPVKTILSNMDKEVRPPYTTLASTIKNLEKKGYITSRLMGNMYLYKPAIKESEFKKNFLTDLVKRHFSNSYKDLVAFFAQQKKISPKDLQEILDMIENRKR
jgi:BlaI family transcriptional regulator, penicillinase repressor